MASTLQSLHPTLSSSWSSFHLAQQDDVFPPEMTEQHVEILEGVLSNPSLWAIVPKKLNMPGVTCAPSTFTPSPLPACRTLGNISPPTESIPHAFGGASVAMEPTLESDIYASGDAQPAVPAGWTEAETGGITPPVADEAQPALRIVSTPPTTTPADDTASEVCVQQPPQSPNIMETSALGDRMEMQDDAGTREQPAVQSDGVSGRQSLHRRSLSPVDTKAHGSMLDQESPSIGSGGASNRGLHSKYIPLTLGVNEENDATKNLFSGNSFKVYPIDLGVSSTMSSALKSSKTTSKRKREDVGDEAYTGHWEETPRRKSQRESHKTHQQGFVPWTEADPLIDSSLVDSPLIDKNEDEANLIDLEARRGEEINALGRKLDRLMEAHQKMTRKQRKIWACLCTIKAALEK